VNVTVNGKDVEPRSITLRESAKLGEFPDINCALVAFSCDMPYEQVDPWLLDQPLQAALAIVRACQEASGYGDQKSDPASDDLRGPRDGI